MHAICQAEYLQTLCMKLVKQRNYRHYARNLSSREITDTIHETCQAE